MGLQVICFGYRLAYMVISSNGLNKLDLAAPIRASFVAIKQVTYHFWGFTMTRNQMFKSTNTDYKHCEILSLAIITRGVLDLNNPNKKISKDAEDFLCESNPMLKYYVSTIAKNADEDYLVEQIVQFAMVGDNSQHAMQQRIDFGRRMSQIMEVGAGNNRAETPKKEGVTMVTPSSSSDFNF